MDGESPRYDAIVIGSGMGGLTTASLLARLRGMRVLVLERHHRLGGFTHSFARPGGRSWGVGLHYVGQMGRGETVRALMDLVTGGAVEWGPMPDPFERYLYPGFTVEQPVGREAYVEALAARWPEEREGIGRYFRRVEGAARWIAPYLVSGGGPGWLRLLAGAAARAGRAVALRTTREVIEECVGDPALRAVLASQWGDYGLPPGRSAFVVHAVIVAHYLGGGWFPAGGAAGIAAGARRVVEGAGGACLVSHAVEVVLTEGGRAIGVRARRGRARGGEPVEFRAPLVVSDAGARLTYERLLAGEDAPAVRGVRERLRALPAGSGVMQLFLGLSRSAEGLGIRGENHWLFAGLDHDDLYARRNALLEGTPTTAYLSFPSLKDPSAAAHTAEVVAPLDHAALVAWAGRGWKRRGAEYEALKERVADALLGFVERHHPGFGALVDYRELATPLTVEHFTAHPAGAIYGLPAVPERYRVRGLGVATPVEGLLLTGSDVGVHGIAGAMMGGVAAAAHVLGGRGFPRIMAAARGPSSLTGGRAAPARPGALQRGAAG